MGLIVILPIAALVIWTVASTYQRVFLQNAPSPWPILFVVLTLAGTALGIWFAFYLEYQPTTDLRIAGFPIPIDLQREINGDWHQIHLPPLIRFLGRLTNLVGGIAIALAPIRLILFVQDFRRGK